MNFDEIIGQSHEHSVCCVLPSELGLSGRFRAKGRPAATLPSPREGGRRPSLGRRPKESDLSRPVRVDSHYCRFNL